MAFFHKTFLITSASLLMSTAVLAADPIDYPPLPTEYVETGFDWDGFYAGVGISASSHSDGISTNSTGYLDAIVGVNITQENFLLGLEAWIGLNRDFNTATLGGGGGIEGRVGYLIDQDVLIYSGIGRYHYDTGAQYTTLGLGTEFAISDNVSIDLEYKYWGWSNTANTGHSFGASANWHF